MSPVDSVIPPKKKTRLSPDNKQPAKARPTAKEDDGKKAVQKPATLPQNRPTPDKKKKMRQIWLLAISITVFIFLAWLFLYPFDGANVDNEASYLEKVGQRFSNIIEQLKTDLLKLENNTNTNQTNTNNYDERVKELEEKIFPQFEDPTRQ